MMCQLDFSKPFITLHFDELSKNALQLGKFTCKFGCVCQLGFSKALISLCQFYISQMVRTKNQTIYKLQILLNKVISQYFKQKFS